MTLFCSRVVELIEIRDSVVKGQNLDEICEGGYVRSNNGCEITQMLSVSEVEYNDVICIFLELL